MKTVVHLTSETEDDWEHAVRCVSLLSQHDELVHEDVALLPHRQGVRLVASDSPHDGDVRELVERGVTITAGATCFDANDLPREVLPGVEIVPSGLSELIELQSEGYNYVKIP